MLPWDTDKSPLRPVPSARASSGKVDTGFPKGSCSTKNPERDDASAKNDRALDGEAGFAQALDAVRVTGWILERQDAPPPLDRKIRSNPHHLRPRCATLINLAKVAVAGCEESVRGLGFGIALEPPLQGR